jgi:hypothetical protein
VLRGYGDPDSIQTKGATSTDVFAQLATERNVKLPAPLRSGPRRPAPRPAAPPPPPPVVALQAKRPDSTVVRVFRGDKVSQQKFETAEAKGSPATP